MRTAAIALTTLAMLLGHAASAIAQVQAPAGTEEQRAALADLSLLDGEWRGEALIYERTGVRRLVQTERIGIMLGGSVRVIEGHGYDPDATTAFNALGVISWDDASDRYRFRAWSNGQFGDFPFTRTQDGYIWESPAGPNAVVRYTATFADGVWHETGAYIREGAAPVPTMEMTLHRLGDTGWPDAGGVDRE